MTAQEKLYEPSPTKKPMDMGELFSYQNPSTPKMGSGGM
jgi:hypothetical protein